MWFFFEIPSFEELQDSDSSPRREEVGRRALRDYGGFLLSFFYRARFHLFTQQVLLALPALPVLLVLIRRALPAQLVPLQFYKYR